VGPIVGLDGCGNPPHPDSIPGTAKIKNSLEVTNKHRTKNTVDEVINLIELKYISFFLPFFSTVYLLTAGAEV